MNDTNQPADLAILEQLNKDFFHSDQFNDVKRFSEFLAEDFIFAVSGCHAQPCRVPRLHRQAAPLQGSRHARRQYPHPQ